MTKYEFENELKEDINILIVDDIPEHVIMAGNILKKLNYKIRVANNAATALKVIEKFNPSLILLDINMSGMNGFELCAKIKADEKYKDAAIIFITANHDINSINKGFSVGGQDYVIKPYNPDELTARVKAHIKIATQSIQLNNAYKELDKFCHSVSHDLKSPLQVIKQLIKMLLTELDENSSLNNDISKIAEKLNLKCTQSIKMIERLLEFSKVTSKDCNFEKVDLNELFKKIYQELISIEPTERQIKLKLSKLPTINGDLMLLTLLFQNILSNSLKFTRNTPQTIIEINSKKSDNENIITIKDNGAGFDMKYSKKLFNVFERLHTDTEFEGSGVGLAITQRIMNKHKGKITITGEQEKGATVTLFFPK